MSGKALTLRYKGLETLHGAMVRASCCVVSSLRSLPAQSTRVSVAAPSLGFSLT